MSEKCECANLQRLLSLAYSHIDEQTKIIKRLEGEVECARKDK
jgi:hypothetical protein